MKVNSASRLFIACCIGLAILIVELITIAVLAYTLTVLKLSIPEYASAFVVLYLEIRGIVFILKKLENVLKRYEEKE